MKKNAFLHKLLLSVTLASLSSAFSSSHDSHEDVDSSCPAQVQQEPTYAPATQWSKIYNVSDDPDARKGHQVLHNSSNKYRHYTENQYAIEFVEQYCKNAKRFDTDAEVLGFASNNAPKEGFIIELGTGAAKTTQFISPLNPKKSIHTFDSYEGLPENWDKGSRIFSKGTFARKDPTFLPHVNNNVCIYIGKFEDKLPRFKDNTLQNNPISFLNVDCDVYSSTKTAFDVLGDNIKPGTIIHFDELYNYPKYKEGEWKAFQEYILRTKYEFEVIAFNEVHEQVVIRILDKI